jgi:hypothetical protein
MTTHFLAFIHGKYASSISGLMQLWRHGVALITFWLWHGWRFDPTLLQYAPCQLKPIRMFNKVTIPCVERTEKRTRLQELSPEGRTFPETRRFRPLSAWRWTPAAGQSMLGSPGTERLGERWVRKMFGSQGPASGRPHLVKGGIKWTYAYAPHDKQSGPICAFSATPPLGHRRFCLAYQVPSVSGRSLGFRCRGQATRVLDLYF